MKYPRVAPLLTNSDEQAEAATARSINALASLDPHRSGSREDHRAESRRRRADAAELAALIDRHIDTRLEAERRPAGGAGGRRRVPPAGLPRPARRRPDGRAGRPLPGRHRPGAARPAWSMRCSPARGTASTWPTSGRATSSRRWPTTSGSGRTGSASGWPNGSTPRRGTGSPPNC